MKASKDIDSYIASYPQKTQVLLKKMRAVICKAAPQATEDTVRYTELTPTKFKDFWRP